MSHSIFVHKINTTVIKSLSYQFMLMSSAAGWWFLSTEYGDGWGPATHLQSLDPSDTDEPDPIYQGQWRRDVTKQGQCYNNTSLLVCTYKAMLTSCMLRADHKAITSVLMDD